MAAKLHCEWCGEPLSEADRLRFEFSQADFESGDGWRSVFEPGPTAEAPLKTCDKCRKGMLENRAALDDEETTADQWRSSGLRWYGFVGCLFLIYVVYRIANLLAGFG